MKYVNDMSHFIEYFHLLVGYFVQYFDFNTLNTTFPLIQKPNAISVWAKATAKHSGKIPLWKVSLAVVAVVAKDQVAFPVFCGLSLGFLPSLNSFPRKTRHGGSSWTVYESSREESLPQAVHFRRIEDSPHDEERA